MTLYGLSSDWDARAYLALLTAAERRGGFCVLAQRQGSSAACSHWMGERADDLESSTKTMRWPGTIVHTESGAVTLLKYRMTPRMVAELRRAAKSPFDWLGPGKPEDLSFLRPDGRPWFVSIAHERDAFFKVLEDEVAELRDQLGELELVPQGEDQTPEERY